MLLRRFSMVPVDSSAARMPLPGAAMAFATDSSDWVDMRISFKPRGEVEFYNLRLAMLSHFDNLHRIGAPGDAEGLADRKHDVVAVLHGAALQQFVLRH